MKKIAFISVLSTITIAVTASQGIGPAQAAPFTSCAQLIAKYPAGVAQSNKAAQKWVKRGYERPKVNRKIFRQVKKLGTSSGVVCGTTTTQIRDTNAKNYMTLVATGSPGEIRTKGAMVALGSPASDYLDYWAFTEEATGWETYGARGVLQPPQNPAPAITKQGTGPIIAYKLGDSAQSIFTFDFDKQNRVQSFSTPAGQIADRLKKISGQASTDGVTIAVSMLYNTNNGQVAITGTATNGSPSPVGMLIEAVYDTTQGRLPAQTTRPCLQPGQTAPFYSLTQIPAATQIPSSWEIRLSADRGSCNTYSQETVITVPIK